MGRRLGKIKGNIENIIRWAAQGKGRSGATIQHLEPHKMGGTRRPEITHRRSCCGCAGTAPRAATATWRPSAEAYEAGRLVHEAHDAATGPVLLWDGRRVLLDDVGGWVMHAAA